MKRTLFRLCATIGCAAALTLAAFAQSTPQKALSDINAARVAASNEARQNNRQVDIAALNARIKEIANEAIGSRTVATTDAKEAYDWAQVFTEAGRHEEACELCEKFLTTNPDPQARFRAQSLMLRNCATLGEAHMIAMVLPSVTPPDANASSSLISNTIYLYLDIVEKEEGPAAALRLLDQVASKAVYEDVDVLAKRNWEAVKRQMQQQGQTIPEDEAAEIAKLRPRAEATLIQQKFTIVEKRAELLSNMGQRPEAIKLLKEYAAAIDPASPAANTVKMAVTRTELVGAPAKPFTVGKTIGDFKSIESLKGKVVLVDFFAHWCGPCIAAFPDMIKMYNDLHDKGLEIVGVTRYYGYYGSERNLAPEVEFAKVIEFKDQHKLPWPVAYVEPTDFTAYGITGIPTIAVIDRQGNVHSLKIGYSADSFAKFRKEVEALLSK